MEPEYMELVLGISIFIPGLIITILSIYWITYVYLMYSEVQRSYLVQSYCGKDVMEKETFRYQLKNGPLSGMFSNFQKAVIVLFTLGVFATLVGFVFQVLLGKAGGGGIHTYFQLLMFLVVLCVYIGVFYTNGISISTITKGYSERWNNVKNKLENILTSSYTDNIPNTNTKHIFVENKLATFPAALVNSLVQRRRTELYIQSNQDASLEMVYTDAGIIEDLERQLFPQEGNLVTVETEKFLELLRPTYHLDPTTKTKKRDLDYIDEAYRDWACENTQINSQLECKTNAYIVPLPEITSYDYYDTVRSTLQRYMIFGWLLFAIMVYTFYHTYYEKGNQRSIQIGILMIILALIIITMYYMMALRYDL